MQTITTVGLDIAKSVFQMHGVDAEGQVVMRRQLKRRYVLAFFQKLSPCLVGIEACASSHHWSRELMALGHTVRLMPPAYVKPYVKRQKNDATDAEAICEAVTRANMRFVATKTPEQQSGMVLHRTRHLFIRQQTAVINAIRAHLAEFGIVAPVGRNGIEELLNEGESQLLEEIYKRGLSQPQIAPDLYVGDGLLMFWTHAAQAPWQTPQWVEQMRGQLRPNAFLRMIENRFVSSESTFVESEWFDRCVDPQATPILNNNSLPVFVGVDASVKKDLNGHRCRVLGSYCPEGAAGFPSHLSTDG